MPDGWGNHHSRREGELIRRERHYNGKEPNLARLVSILAVGKVKSRGTWGSSIRESQFQFAGSTHRTRSFRKDPTPTNVRRLPNASSVLRHALTGEEIPASTTKPSRVATALFHETSSVSSIRTMEHGS